jgi:hypothetical protein
MRSISRKIGLAAALAALVAAQPALAAAYIKFEGVDGETMDKGHDRWIAIESYAVSATSAPAATDKLKAPDAAPHSHGGGVRVATGDVNGDGAVSTPREQGRNIRGVLHSTGTMVLQGALPNCREGARYASAVVREEGVRHGLKLENVAITACAANSYTLSFARIAW